MLEERGTVGEAYGDWMQNWCGGLWLLYLRGRKAAACASRVQDGEVGVRGWTGKVQGACRPPSAAPRLGAALPHLHHAPRVGQAPLVVRLGAQVAQAGVLVVHLAA